VRGVLDYALLPAAEAADGESANVYVGKHSGKRWKTDHPPPRPCFNCGAMHWRSDCPVQQEKEVQSSSHSFPRGKPPGRYYISKTGRCYDTQRRPTAECQKCGKLHWWFCCPKGGDVFQVPRGARFTDQPPTEARPQNQHSARFRRAPATETDLDDTAGTELSSSEAEERLPQKRTRSQHARRSTDTGYPAQNHSHQLSSPPPQPNPGGMPYGWYPPMWYPTHPWVSQPNPAQTRAAATGPMSGPPMPTTHQPYSPELQPSVTFAPTVAPSAQQYAPPRPPPQPYSSMDPSAAQNPAY
jgi:hypothetical protein